MTCKRGELLLVPYPFTDLSTSKRRPVLALTGSDRHGDFIALPVTSRPHHVNAVPVLPSDLLSGFLPAASWVRTDRIVTLNEALVLKSIAAVPEALVSRAIRQLCDRLSSAEGEGILAR